jgi:hypothetical protein
MEPKRDNESAADRQGSATEIAVNALIETIIFHLRRHEFQRALALSQTLLQNDATWHANAPMEVLRTAMFRDALTRGVSRIKGNAKDAAIEEFKRALEIWEASAVKKRNKLARKAMNESAA